MFEYTNVHIQTSNAYAVLLLGFEECLSEQKKLIQIECTQIHTM